VGGDVIMRKCTRSLLKGRSDSGNMLDRFQFGISARVFQTHSQRFAVTYWPIRSVIVDMNSVADQQNTGVAICFT
jgi:hypothetical protein